MSERIAPDWPAVEMHRFPGCLPHVTRPDAVVPSDAESTTYVPQRSERQRTWMELRRERDEARKRVELMSLEKGETEQEPVVMEALNRVCAERDELTSALKVWKQATESRCRLLSSRESSDSLLAPDRALIEAVERIEGKVQ